MLLKEERVPRAAPLAPPYDDRTAALLEALGGPLSVFRLLARKPDRAEAVLAWGRYYLSRRLSLTVRQRELVIHRTTARCGSDYEWGVHVAVFAEKSGLSAAQVASTAHGGPDDACWTDAGDRAVLTAVDALVDGHDLDEATWSELVAHVGDEGALDLLLVCGWYHAISFLTRVPRLPQEPGTPRFADRLPARGGPSDG